MNTFVFQPSLTWRKAGFAFLSDSLGYREVLSENPSWDITKQPAPGSVLFKPKSRNSSGLTQPASTVGVSVAGYNELDVFFPFDGETSYAAALEKYTLTSLLETDRLNGWSSVSPEVLKK